MLDRWMALLARVSDSASPGETCAVYEDLQARYTTADRRYHNIQHIAVSLCLLDSVRGLAEHPDSLELALWFHDAIYDSRKYDNEECSARLADDALRRLGVPQTTTQRVHDLILATRHNAPPANPDAALLVDIDLAILGQPATIFDDYEAGIRFEYAWVPERAYRSGRVKVLRTFLERPRIYATDHFYAAYESAACENLTRSLGKLNG